MKFISNAKLGQPVESGTIFQGNTGGMTIAIHKKIHCEGWFLTCHNLGIKDRPLKKQSLMAAIKESREILKMTIDDMQRNINMFCGTAIEISRY